MVLTAEDALYCLIVCFDNQENIQRNTGKLDDFGGDIVSIMLDTFGDKKTHGPELILVSRSSKRSRLEPL